MGWWRRLYLITAESPPMAAIVRLNWVLDLPISKELCPKVVEAVKRQKNKKNVEVGFIKIKGLKGKQNKKKWAKNIDVSLLL